MKTTKRNRVNLPGGTDFRAIREAGCYYVDKSSIISRLVRQGANNSFLFVRPRRFGKTTLQSMLSCFFDIRQDSRALFEGLAVMGDGFATGQWMNRYPVIFLSLKDVDGLAFDSAFHQLAFKISQVYREYSFLLEDGLPGADRKLFSQILDMSASFDDVIISLARLVNILRRHYERQVVILIDEYDVPFAKAEANGYYHKMLATIRTLLSSVLKDNRNVAKAVITGCLRVSRESIFTGLNNLDVYSLSCDGYADCFGFTESEVAHLLHDAGFEDKADLVRKRYDGYRIGGQRIYCPWDVLKYVGDLQVSPSRLPMNYWLNSSGNVEVRRFLKESRQDISAEYNDLMNGGTIEKSLSDELTYDDLYSSDDNLWSLLFACGYLTLDGEYEPNGLTRLRLPNEEVRMLFSRTIYDWFMESSACSQDFVDSLYAAIWKGDAAVIASLLTSRMGDVISYHDYGESFYHAFLLGLLASSKSAVVRSNRETGEGRADIIVQSRRDGMVAIFELKRISDKAKMGDEADAALRQIAERDYSRDYADAPSVLHFGLCFCRKSVEVKCDTV